MRNVGKGKDSTSTSSYYYSHPNGMSRRQVLESIKGLANGERNGVVRRTGLETAPRQGAN